MADAYKSYRKVRDVITHSDNQLKHIPGINQLVRNYENKFPEEVLLIKALCEYKCDLEEILTKQKNYE
jgi:hypothetical protein